MKSSESGYDQSEFFEHVLYTMYMWLAQVLLLFLDQSLQLLDIFL